MTAALGTYLQDPNGRWFHYLDERLLDELRRSSR
jgi:hypothetical protein